VLFIDDDPDIRLVGTRALKGGSGWEVKACASGREGIAALGSFDPDLVVCDVMMPGLDGPGTLRALREAGCSAPAILMTARTGRRHELEYREAGAVGTIAKPFDPVSLPGLLRKLVEGEGRPTDAETRTNADAAVAAATRPDSLTERFVANLRSKLELLHELFTTSLATADSRTSAIRITHQLAGSAGSFGFPSIMVAAGGLELLLVESRASREWGPEVLAALCELDEAVAKDLAKD
jgi:DNA-binding response OmpR family regulator